MKKIYKAPITIFLFLFGLILVATNVIAQEQCPGNKPLCTNANSSDCLSAGGTPTNCWWDEGLLMTGTCCESEEEEPEEPEVYPPCDLGFICTDESLDCPGYYQTCSGPGTYVGEFGSCCEPEEFTPVGPCAPEDYCYDYDPDCTALGFTQKRCKPEARIGCCKPVGVEELCPDGFTCATVTPNCSGFGDPIGCDTGGALGCCIPDPPRERVPCKRNPDFGCRDSCMGIPSAYIEDCGPNGVRKCCVPGVLDEGQVDCGDDGCQNMTISECNQLASIGAEVANCGGNGAQGCCVPGASDEDFYDDPEMPIPVEPENPDDPKEPGIFGNLFDKFKTSEQELAAETYNFVMPVGVAIGIGSIIIAGYGFMTSQGNPDKVKDAKERLTAAVAGTLFIVLSLVILKVIINTLF